MRLLLIFFSLSLLTSPAVAENSIPIESGLWEITTTMTSPMSEQPQVKTTQECMDQDSISVEDISPGDGNECDTIETNVNGSTLTWSMQCSAQGGTMSGSGNFTSNGDSGHGNMQMDMSIQGQSMSMTMSWKGKRISSC